MWVPLPQRLAWFTAILLVTNLIAAIRNVAIAITAGWQGNAAEGFGYPLTLLIDALAGLVVQQHLDTA
jgi:hypothetical protein